MGLGLISMLNLILGPSLRVDLVLGLKIDMSLGIGGITYDKKNNVEEFKLLEC